MNKYSYGNMLLGGFQTSSFHVVFRWKQMSASYSCNSLEFVIYTLYMVVNRKLKKLF